jgi:hypothetical protein
MPVPNPAPEPTGPPPTSGGPTDLFATAGEHLQRANEHLNDAFDDNDPAELQFAIAHALTSIATTLDDIAPIIRRGTL